MDYPAVSSAGRTNNVLATKMIWFTADLHIDHPWMAKERGFSYTSKHDDALIQGWNKHVKRGDHVIVCGDIFWTDFSHIINIWKLLHGTKTIIKGNHDHWIKKHPDIGKPYHKIYEHNYKVEGGTQKIVACHYPMRSWNQKANRSIHVHGHSHGKLLPHWKMMDVGVDVAKLMTGEWRPFSLDEIIYLLKERKEQKHASNHHQQDSR